MLYPSNKEKKRKRKEILNNDLAVWPSHDKAKAVYPCFEHWGSTIGFLIRGLQNHLDSSVNLA